MSASESVSVPGVLAVPPRADLATIAVAIVAVSTSGPLMAATAAPALAIAFWRNGFAALGLAPWTLVRHRAELASLSARDWLLGTTAGLFLALHFATWVPSLRFTNVATATALVSTQPIWAAFIARRSGAHIPRAAWIGIGIAVLGVGVLTGVDVSTSWRALGGDLLAIAGGATAAAYMAFGSEVRRHVSTPAYTTICYLTTALLLLVACVVGAQSLAGYPAVDWLRLVALTIGAQFLGHSLFNRVLRTTSPTVVALAILFEVPGAALLAAAFLGQRPSAVAIPGLVLLLVGIGTVIATRDRSGPASIPASIPVE